MENLFFRLETKECQTDIQDLQAPIAQHELKNLDSQVYFKEHQKVVYKSFFDSILQSAKPEKPISVQKKGRLSPETREKSAPRLSTIPKLQAPEKQRTQQPQ